MNVLRRDTPERSGAHTSRSRRRHRLLIGAIGIMSVVACSAGADRSVAAFCRTLHDEKERIRGQLDENIAAAEQSGDETLEVLLGLGAGVQALGELRVYFRKLADHAPEEIRVEAELVADEYEKQLDEATEALDNPLGALADGVMSSLTISGPMNTLNDFAVRECDETL